ncbi:MAG: glucose-1-phosphate thymidylyltransferase RfbA [Nanoarchaeota archaeon]|nr:glucose-1-phosphate thymidylyltransferase RfbA [Nanoarchaeota archaeon]
MKGIVLAGGKATRLYPSTKVVSKQLLPIYDKPLIYYPLSTLMLADIRDILIISTKEDIGRFEELLGTGSEIGMNFSYASQEKPRGIGEAFIIGKDFIEKDRSCLILGDNIFYGNEFPRLLKEANQNEKGATVFCYEVSDPKRYGVAELDIDKKRVLSIEEKPEKPKSKYAVTGLYFYDNNVVSIAENLKPSARGELEITDINKIYLESGELESKLMGRGFTWLDTGTFDSMAEATEFIKVVQNRQGLKIGCIEEIAFRKGFIDRESLKKIAEPLKNSGYGEYLLNL